MRIALSVADKEKAKGADSAYFKALVAAGAQPEEIELLAAADASRVRAEEFDGILFAGGADVEPKLYGQEKKYQSVETDSARDRFELQLLNRARDTGLPVFGICRGLQMINVAYGGTLYQDLKEDRNVEIQHQQVPSRSRQDLTHAVTVTEPESTIAAAIRASSAVNSMHQQAVDKMGRGLKATAYSEDGFVEALEAADGYPLLAVQWHPEEIADHPEQLKIFEEFLAKCRATSAKRKGLAQPA
jgi:gamma-glutamyl-gamma-aminobutyrate hydrolase PuuD